MRATSTLTDMQQPGGDASFAAERDACHAARDAFFSCVQDVAPDTTTRRDALAAPQCASQRAALTAACRRSWVRYWDDRWTRGLPLRRPGGE